MRHFCIVALVCLSAATARGDGPYFIGLGDLTGGSFNSAAGSVSYDGSAVAGFGISASGREAFRWTAATGMVGLGDLPTTSFFSEAHAISGDGATVGGLGYLGGSAFEAFRWTQPTGMTGLGWLGLGIRSSVEGASADASVLVGQSENVSADGKHAWTEAFRWTQASGMVGLGDFLPDGTQYSISHAVSANGAVVVGEAASPLGNEAFRWTQATGMVSLGDLHSGPGPYSIANAISANGNFIAGQGTRLGSSSFEAFLWTQTDGMKGLGVLSGGAIDSVAYGVSDDGIVVGNSAGSTGRPHAFIWDSAHNMRDLRDVLISDYGMNLSGWTLVEARAITPDGLTIVGSGFNPSGQQEAWLAHVPEPCSLLLILSSAFIFLRRRPTAAPRFT